MSNPGLKVGDKLRWLKQGTKNWGSFDCTGLGSGPVDVVVTTVGAKTFECSGECRSCKGLQMNQFFEFDELANCFEPMAAASTITPTVSLALCHCCTRPNEYGAGANYPKSAPANWRCGECRTLYGAS